jgi:uncharacterized protein (DUF2267 family)
VAGDPVGRAQEKPGISAGGETEVHHDAFIGQVQARARLRSRGEAERATRAVLETLGDRIPEGLADNLAAQLPQEIGDHLRRTEVLGGAGTGVRFGRDEFITLVSERSGFDGPKAAFASRAVCEVVGEAVQGGLMAKVREGLPTDLQVLVTAGSSGEMRG